MATAETNIVNKVMVRLSTLNVVCWKNIRGMFLTLDGKRKAKAGLQVNGSSDLIGGAKVVVTKSMVGKHILVFTAAEIKTSTGIVSSEQKDFIAFISNSGGIAFVARSADESEEKLNAAIKKMCDL